MANSEALQELQNRLATRLKEVKSGSVLVSWLAIESGGGRYLLPLAQSGEIFSFHAPQRVPYTKPWFAGVCNLRGSLYGVVDLAAYVSGRRPEARSDQQRSESRLVVFNAQLEINVALLIERLAGLRSADVFVSSSDPAAGSAPYCGRLYADRQGVSWQEINMRLLSQQSDFLDISITA